MNWLHTFIWVLKQLSGLAKILPAKHSLPVLIVDDSAEDAALIAIHVQDEGAEAKIVHSLKEAQVLVDSIDFRLIFLDVHFPGGSGIDFAKQIRPKHPKLPVVFITGHAEDLSGLPSGRKWSFISKGSSGGSMMEAVKDAMLEANGMNGHLPLQGVVVVVWILCAISALLGFFAKNLPSLTE